jgi:pilus assembly protein CpaB
VISVCASYLVFRSVTSRARTVSHTLTVPVVVAARDLTVGSLISEYDLKTAAWSGPLMKGSMSKTDSILNRGVASPIFEGEPVTEARLAPQGSGGGLAGTIPQGMRACAVKVNEVAGVAGFVVSGMRVDVLITGSPPGGNPQVRTILENIQVLSAGTDFQRDQTGKPQQAQVVNLLVTPAQAEILSLAGNEMHIQLVLRNPMDIGILKPGGAIEADLFGSVRSSSPPQPVSSTGRQPEFRPPAQPVAAPPVPARPFVVDVLNGSVHTVAQFNQNEVQP